MAEVDRDRDRERRRRERERERGKTEEGEKYRLGEREDEGRERMRERVIESGKRRALIAMQEHSEPFGIRSFFFHHPRFLESGKRQ